MTDETLELYIRQLLESHRTPEVTIAWQGGEPTLMGLEFFRRAVELARSTHAGQTIVHTIQTNGTMLDDAVGALLPRERLPRRPQPRRAARAARRLPRDKGGSPTFDRVMRGLAALREHGVEWNALTTVNAANEAHPAEVYRFLRDELRLRVRPVHPHRRAAVRGRHRPTAARSPSGRSRPQGWGGFLIGVFDEWVRRDVGGSSCSSSTSPSATGTASRPASASSPASCGAALALEHNGDVYACDHFVEPAYRLGNVREPLLADLVGSPAAAAVRRRQARRAAALLPRMRRALRLPRRLPQGPLRRRAGRRAGAQLSLRRLQGVLPPRRRADAAHVRAAARRTARRPTSSRSTPATDARPKPSLLHDRWVTDDAHNRQRTYQTRRCE